MLLNGDYNAHPHMTGYTDKEGIWRANQLIPDGSDANTEAWADFLHRSGNYLAFFLLAFCERTSLICLAGILMTLIRIKTRRKNIIFYSSSRAF